MTLYRVHLYREMRLTFDAVEAGSAQAAAAVARERPTHEADDIEDCNGEDLAALVDVAGDDQYEHSVTIDFEAERLRKAGPKLREALNLLLGEIRGLAGEFPICREILASSCGRAAETALAGAAGTDAESACPGDGKGASDAGGRRERVLDPTGKMRQEENMPPPRSTAMTHYEYTAEDLKDYFLFLDGLRESAVTNMCAAAPYLCEQFGIDEHDARTILAMWMDSCQPGIGPGERAQAALARKTTQPAAS